VELSASLESCAPYFIDFATSHLHEARQFAALRVATNKNVAQARVLDIDSGVICYTVDNPLLARADIITWGGIRLTLPATVLRYLNDNHEVTRE